MRQGICGLVQRSCPILSILILLYGSLADEVKLFYTEFITPDTARIGEYEFLLISEMSCHLIIHHPYRTLLELQTPLSLSSEELSLAWSIINDHYLTDIPLLYPPHVVAVTAIFLALVFGKAGGGVISSSSNPAAAGSAVQNVQSVNAAAVLANAAANLNSPNPLSPFTTSPSISSPLGNAGAAPSTASTNTAADPAAPLSALNLPPATQTKIQNFVAWLASGEVDIKAMVECTQEIVSLYEVLEGYSEKGVRDAVGRYVKGRGLDK